MSRISINLFSFGLNSLQNHGLEIGKTLERLSTGKRINRGSDDPAGLIAATDLSRRAAELEKQIESLDRKNSRLGAMDGSLSVVNDFAIELQGLVVSAANTGGLGEGELDAIALQVGSVLEGIDLIAGSASFAGQQLLSGFETHNLGNITITKFDDQGQLVSDSYSLADLQQLIEDDPEVAQQVADAALEEITSRRAAIGVQERENESMRRVLSEEYINTQGALSQIQDTDFAKETGALVRQQILQQASIQAIVIKRQSAKQVLSLLENASAFARS